MLLLTLATRACLAVGGLSTPLPDQLYQPVNSNISNSSSNNISSPLMRSNPNGLAVLNPLAPHWQLLTEPGAWLEATIQVNLSYLQNPPYYYNKTSSDRWCSPYNWEQGLSQHSPAFACRVTIRSTFIVLQNNS